MQKIVNYYCLHHTPSVDRKAYMLDFFQEQQINVEWIENFLPTSDEIINYPTVRCIHAANKLGILNSQEISLCFKHILAIKKICKINGYGIIFEDDVKKTNWSLNKYLPLLIKEYEKINGDILWIGSDFQFDIKSNDKIKIISNDQTKSRLAHCYMIHSKTANKVIEYYTDIKAPADWQWNLAIDHFHLKSCWSYPSIYQRTAIKEIQSLLR